MATQAEIAAHLDLSERQVRNLMSDSVLPGSKGRGGYNIDDCRNAYIRHLRNQTRRGTEQESEPLIDPDSLEYQRLRLTREQADNMALKNEQARAKLIPIELLTMILSRVAGEWAGLIDTIPLNLKRKHPQLDTQLLDDIKWHCVKAQNSVARLDAVTDEVVADYAASVESE